MLRPKDLRRISRLASRYKLDYIRLFGSGVKSLTRSRDIDIAVGGKSLTLPAYSELHDLLETLFQKPVDLIQLRPGLSSRLVLEIAAHSIPLWEEHTRGRVSYVRTMDRLHAIAIDEEISNPAELRDQAIRRVTRRLRVA